jgi:hypothetical protein
LPSYWLLLCWVSSPVALCILAKWQVRCALQQMSWALDNATVLALWK